MLDLTRWAVVAFKDETGLGRMVEDFKSVLGFGRHIVIPSERLSDGPLSAPREVMLDPKDAPHRVREVLDGLQGIVSLERSHWHPQLFPLAREMGIRTVCVPMWEWFKAGDPLWRFCDLFICPNQHCLSVVQKLGFANAVALPTALDLAKLPERQVSGPARLFIHNAGLIDHDDRKGTRDVVRAFTKVNRGDVRLVVRMQKEAALPREARDGRIEVRVGNLSDPSDLYREGDVALQPSKMEGLGFMVIEPVCCGLPVVTLDYSPMNEFVRQPEMRARPRPFARRSFASQWVKQAHLRLPSTRDLTRRIEWCAEHDMSAISTENRQWALETFDLARLREVWSHTLSKHLGQHQAP